MIERMQSPRRPRCAVVLPGTGSDADFVGRAFGPALRGLDLEVIAVEPDPRGVVASYVAALDAAVARSGPIVVGGVSLGAAVALNWANDRIGAAAAVLVALPAWTGSPDGAPAAASAELTARLLRADGIAAVTATMRAGSPPWLGAELAKSWASQWPHLPDALDEASKYRSPTPAALAATTVPVALVTAVDDPVHPYAVAQAWHAALPDSGVAEITLDEIGVDPSVIGRAALKALEQTKFRW